jgi:AraC family transcriptional regulator of adaptative response / DNA-3-methyladenine glycosylase II
VADGRYARTVRIVHRGVTQAGTLSVGPLRGRDAAEVHVDARLSGVLPRIVACTKRLFDLACPIREVEAALGPLAASRSGLRVPGAFDGFEMAVRAVLGQQVTVQAARTIAGRFATAFGDPIQTGIDGLDRVFPSPATVAALPVGAVAELGIVSARARAIIGLAARVADGRLALEPESDVTATLEALRQIPGIGDWTAEYIAMRALAWPDAFPEGDIGVMKALGDRHRQRVRERAGAWRPWRAYAVMHLWHSLEPRVPSVSGRCGGRRRAARIGTASRPDGRVMTRSRGENSLQSDSFRGGVMLFSSLDWPLGALTLVSDGNWLTGVHFVGGRDHVEPGPDWQRADRAEPLAAARRQLEEYFRGERREFDLPLRPRGTAFQQRVWAAIAGVPFGETITYRDLARRAGSPDGSRAAGLATGQNPLALIIPCHRIVGSNGSLTGFGGGLDRKRALLDFEHATANGRPARLEPTRTLRFES